MRILLIEDDFDIGDGIVRTLKRYGYTVDWFQDGAQGQSAITRQAFYLAILDLGLPSINGMDILMHWRSHREHLPILILTARNATIERISGLNAGADDYLGKPFETDELIARMKALLRRQRGNADNLLNFGDLVINTSSQTVKLRDKIIPLRANELMLLKLFLSQPSRIMRREYIEDKLYSWDSNIESNAVQVHIHSLRKHFGKDFIITHRGLGYQLGNKP